MWRNTGSPIRLSRWQAGRTKRALPAALKDRLCAADVIAMDVDGVLTDGRRYEGQTGLQALAFDARDGLGIDLAIRAGYRVIWVSSLRSEIVEQRAQFLGVAEQYLGTVDKAAVLERLGTVEKTIFIGDDIWDVGAFDIAGVAIAVGDAHPDAIARSDLVTSNPGGRGAVREVVDLLFSLRAVDPIALLKRLP